MRDWARPNGKHCYESYKALGAYDSLLAQLRQSDEPPRFEFELRGPVSHNGESFVLLGKPDVVFSLGGQKIIYDWKVNGYCGKSSKSPEPGYTMLRGGTRNAGKAHKDCKPETVNGIVINTRCGLENVNGSWARQVSIYAWLLGAPVGSDFVSGIDQLVGKPTDGFPEIRVAEHRYRIGMMFQNAVFSTASAIHARDQTGPHLRGPHPRRGQETSQRPRPDGVCIQPDRREGRTVLGHDQMMYRDCPPAVQIENDRSHRHGRR